MTAVHKIDQILYATDLSENFNHAFEYAVAVTNFPGTEITVRVTNVNDIGLS